jgi:hypothetical protein
MASDICLALALEQKGCLFKEERQVDDEDSVVSRKTEIMDWRAKRVGAFEEAS